MLSRPTLGSSAYELMAGGENEDESGKDASQASVSSSVDGQYTLQKVSFRARLHHKVFGNTHTTLTIVCMKLIAYMEHCHDRIINYNQLQSDKL